MVVRWLGVQFGQYDGDQVVAQDLCDSANLDYHEDQANAVLLVLFMSHSSSRSICHDLLQNSHS